MPTNWMKRAAWSPRRRGGRRRWIGWFAWPRPIAVDLATVAKGPMEVTVDDEAKTRVRHIYTVSAPIAGKVLRISHPAAPGPRSRRRSGDGRRDCRRGHAADRAELSSTSARTRSCRPALSGGRRGREAGGGRSAPDRGGARILARPSFERAQALARTDAISPQGAGQGEVRRRDQRGRAWQAPRRSSTSAAASARASPRGSSIPPSGSQPTNPSCCIEVRAPVTGAS